MKAYMKALIALLAILALLSACRPAVTTFEAGDTVGADETAEDTLTGEISAEEIAEYQDELADPDNGTPLTVDSVTTDLAALGEQVLRIVFSNGVVDEDTVTEGIKVFTLTDTADADGAYGRGEDISGTRVIPDGAGGCTVEMTLDLSGDAISSPIEVFLDSDVVTANDGTNLLDPDFDGVYGEANEDDVIRYTDVTLAPLVPPGGPRDPQGYVDFQWQNLGFTSGGSTVTIPVYNSAGGTGGMTTDSLSAGITVFKFDAATGTWIASDATPSYDAGLLTYTTSAPIAPGDLFRYEVNLPAVREAESVNGYVHGAGFNQWNPDQRDFVGYLGPVHPPDFLADVTTAQDNPEVTSSTDLTGGFDWFTTPQDFLISRDGGAEYIINLDDDTTPGPLSAVVTEVNDGFTAAGADGFMAYAHDSNLDGGDDSIRIVDTWGGGPGSVMTLGPGTTDALDTLGLTAGNYTGTDTFERTTAGLPPEIPSEMSFPDGFGTEDYLSFRIDKDEEGWWTVDIYPDWWSGVTDAQGVVDVLNLAFENEGIDDTFQAFPAGDSFVIRDVSGDVGSGHYIAAEQGGGWEDALAPLGIPEDSFEGEDLEVSGLRAGGEEFQRHVDLNFAHTVDPATVTPDSLKIVNASSGGFVNWSADGLTALGPSTVRIYLPGTFAGSEGSFFVRIFPTVTDSMGVPYANTDVAGTRADVTYPPGGGGIAGIGDQVEMPFWNSPEFGWCSTEEPEC
jgi:hypothetical protein